MAELLDFIRIALAAFYVSKMVTQSAGPFAMFEFFRGWAGNTYDETGTYAQPMPGSLAEWSQCIWCMSIYVAVPLSFIPVGWLTPLSIAGAIVWLEK